MFTKNYSEISIFVKITNFIRNSSKKSFFPGDVESVKGLKKLRKIILRELFLNNFVSEGKVLSALNNQVPQQAKKEVWCIQRLPKGTWNDNSHEATQNLMFRPQRLLSFWLVISRLLAQTCCSLAVVVSAIVTSQWWPGGEVVISMLLQPWDPRRLNWKSKVVVSWLLWFHVLFRIPPCMPKSLFARERKEKTYTAMSLPVVCRDLFAQHCCSDSGFLEWEDDDLKQDICLIRSQKGLTKHINHTNSTKEFSEQFEGTTGSLPSKTQGFWGTSHQKVPPNVRQKSLSHSQFVVPFLSPIWVGHVGHVHHHYVWKFARQRWHVDFLAGP